MYLEQFKINPKDLKNHCLIHDDFESVSENISQILQELGNKGVIMFTENTALIYFRDSNIRMQLKNKQYFKVSDFKVFDEGFLIIGKDPDLVKPWLVRFLEDVKTNLFKILGIIFIFFLLANPIAQDIDIIKTLNDKLVDIIGFLIGMVFVFIGFLYADKDRSVEVYKHGLSYKEYKTDCYVINLAIIALITVCISVLISNTTSSDIPEGIFHITFIARFVNSEVRYWLSFALTGLALSMIVIEFDSLTNYYLKSSRNKYFIDAFEEIINEYKQK